MRRKYIPPDMEKILNHAKLGPDIIDVVDIFIKIETNTKTKMPEQNAFVFISKWDDSIKGVIDDSVCMGRYVGPVGVISRKRMRIKALSAAITKHYKEKRIQEEKKECVKTLLCK